MLNVYTTRPSEPATTAATLTHMPREKAEGKRYFVRLTDEQKRRLDFLAVDAGATSTEEYGGRLLAESIDRLWSDFDPKRADPKRKQADKSK